MENIKSAKVFQRSVRGRYTSCRAVVAPLLYEVISFASHRIFYGAAATSETMEHCGPVALDLVIIIEIFGICNTLSMLRQNYRTLYLHQIISPSVGICNYHCTSPMTIMVQDIL